MDRAVPLVWAGRYKGIFAAFVIFALVFPFPALVYAQEADVPPAAEPSPAAQEPASAPTDTAPADAPSEAPAAPDTAPGEVLGEETVAPSADTPAVDDPLAPDSPAPTEEPAVQPDPQPETLLSVDAGDSTNSSTNSLNPQFYAEPDPVTGSLVYEYALTVPPGRNGMEPTIPLRYTSQPSENTHVLGYGWDVKIPYIERINRTGTQSMYSQTYFRSSIDGEIVQASTTNTAIYSAKIDTGDFNQYQYSTSTGWVMTDKKGTIYTFGTSTAGRMDNPSNSSQVFRWVLQEMRDTNGNYVSYQYAKDQGQIYPYKISYTNSTTTSGRFEVEFLTEARSDVATSSDTGFPIVDAKRINEVQVKVDGSWVRKYVLGYGTGDNGARTMLSTITESGKDDAGAITTLPPVTFQYQAVNKGWTDASVTMPVTFGNYTTLADVNGDSLVDIIDSTKDTSGAAILNTYINNGTNWVASSTWRVPMYFYILQTGAHPPNPDQGVRFADVNGDGLADLIQSADGLASTTKTYLNNGAGWTATTTWAPPVMFVGSTTAFEMGARVVDANGDGLSDILYGNTGSYVGYINNGSSWVASSTWNPPVDFVNFNSTRPLQIEDINGDGLVDMVDSASGGSFGAHNNVYINNGAGWTIDPQWTMPVVFQDASGYDLGVRLGDANGDGLIDVLQSPPVYGTSTQVYLNTGHAWVASSTWSIPVTFVDSGNNEPMVWLADTNGDGLIDLLENKAGIGNDVFINNTEKTDVLTRITYPQGGNTSFAYKAAAEYKNGSTPLNPLIPFTVDTVSSVTLDDGLGGIATTTYSYEGGNYYVASSTDRRLGGFQKITKTDPAGNKTLTYFHQGNGSNTSTGEYQDDGSKIGKVYRTEVYDGSNNLYSKSIVKWDKTSLGSGRTWVDMAQQVSSAYDGDSDHKDKAVSYAYSTTTGNLIQKFDWGEVNGSDDGSFSDTGTDFGSTTLSYAASTTAPGFVSSQLTQDQSANKVSETRYYYDGLSLGSVTKGNQTKKENWIVSSSYASTTKAYNGFGLVVQDRDAKGNLTSYTYDTSNLYPATSTNALSQATGYVYDYSSGNVIQKYDPNNRMHVQVYDGLDRPLASLEPDPSTGALATTTTYAYASSTTPGSTSITQTQYLSSATSTARYTYFDGLNRKLQERVQSETPTTYAAKDWKYNSRALVGSESLPYFSSGSSRTSATTDNTLYTSYIYDPLQRVTAVGNAVGTTTNAYDQWQTSTTDPDGKLKGYLKDARDNLVSVLEYATTTPFVTGYTWDLNGNLLSITDNASNTRSFIYDGLSRRTNAQDLHAPVDATFGSTTYTYDVAGNLTQKLDAKNQTVQYAYDTLNRLLTENYTGAAGTEVTYTYDSCTDGKGKVCTASSTGALTQYNYTPTGLVKVATTTIVGTTTAFATSYDYDRQGNQATITYPDAGQVQYLYNAAGLVDAIQKKENGDSSFGALVTNIDYAPTGKPTLTQYANGDNATSTYNSSALYRLSRIQSKNNAGLTLQDLNYTYDAVGNITQLLDLASSTANATTTYSYDDLHRLTQALYSAPTGSYTQTYAYDSLGNITNKSDIGAYTYAGTGYANPHAATTIAGSAHSYDNNGNLISGGGFTYAWDYANRLTSAGSGSATSTYAYDQDGARVKLIESGVATYFPNKLYNVAQNSATTTKSIFAGDQLVATVDMRAGNSGGGSATSTVFKTAGTINETTGFTNLTVSSISTSNNVYATSFTSDPVGRISNFTFGVPSGATINGIEVTVEAKRTSGSEDVPLSLSWNAGSNFSSTATNTITSTEAVFTYGGPTSLWGRSWTDSELSNTNFQVKIDPPSSVFQLSFDQIRAKVYYTPAGATTSASTTIRYVHPDHLGSTNVVTDSLGNTLQTLQYHPYGSISAETGTDVSRREFIGEVTDELSGLNYLNARYYQANRGQFLSQDPVFWEVGQTQDGKAVLMNPQLQNSYSYAGNNPIINKDPSGRFIDVPWISNNSWVQGAATDAYNYNSTWRFAMDHPYTTSAITAIAAYPAVASGGAAASAFGMATFPGVGGSFAAQQTFAGLVYSSLGISSTFAVSGIVGDVSRVDTRNPSSFYPAAYSLTTNVGPSVIGGYPGAVSDAVQFGGIVSQGVGSLIRSYSSSLNSSQSRSLSGINSNFNAKNMDQAKAVTNVIKAFGQKKK